MKQKDLKQTKKQNETQSKTKCNSYVLTFISNFCSPEGCKKEILHKKLAPIFNFFAINMIYAVFNDFQQTIISNPAR